MKSWRLCELYELCTVGEGARVAGDYADSASERVVWDGDIGDQEDG